MLKNFVRVGQKVRFDPFETSLGFGIDELRYEVEGTVVDVYPEHKWFSVVYGDPKQRISFKFFEIGERVMIVG
jgi:hypothetical protein